MLKGILEGCVLQIISRGETYGYAICQQLNALGFTEVIEGTVYTILLRFERNKLVTVRLQASTIGPPRKLFTLNRAGRAELERFWTKWIFLVEKLEQIKEEEK
jgi:DNA-binding PadR family transcriptional regulator